MILRLRGRQYLRRSDMQAIHGIYAHRLTARVVLVCLLAGGLVGYWFDAWHRTAPANASAGQKVEKKQTPAAQNSKAASVVAVIARYPGMSPQAMESEITNRLEMALGHAEGLRAIESQTTTGLSIVQLHFDESVTPPIALAQAAGLAGAVVPHFPPGTPTLEVLVVDQARTLPVCMLVIDCADMSLQQHADMARQYILGELASSAGVTAHLGPAAERVIAIMLDPRRLQAHKMSVQTVQAALAEAAAPPPAGMVRIGNRQLLLTSPLLSLDDLEKMAVRKDGVYLRDVAGISDFSDVPTALGRVNGRRRVWVAIHAKKGTSAAAAKDAVSKALARMRGRLPRGAKLEMLTFGNDENTDAGAVTLHVRAAAGTRLEVCEKLVAQVEQYLKMTIAPEDVRFMVAHVGPDATASPAWPLRAGPHQATIRMQLTQPAAARELVKKLRPLLRKRFPDLHTSLHAGAGTSWPVVVRVGGGTPSQCEKLAGQVVDRIAKLREAADVEVGEPLPCLHVNVDRAKAAALGVAQADVQSAILAIGPGITCRVHVAQAGMDSGAKVRVTLRLPELESTSLQDLSNIPIMAPKVNEPILLRDLATIKTADAPAEIEHQERTRVVAVRVNTDDVDGSTLARSIENSLKNLPRAEGMWLKVQTNP
jgi:multidrug efflux pump subunit AcrB